METPLLYETNQNTVFIFLFILRAVLFIMHCIVTSSSFTALKGLCTLPNKALLPS